MTVSHALRVQTSSSYQAWRTPPSFLQLVRRLGPMGLDPCASPTIAHHVARVNYWTRGLSRPWRGHGLVFVNPPFDEADSWANKCFHAMARPERGDSLVLLAPARVDTAWHEAVVANAEAVLTWRGRLKFGDARGRFRDSAPFPVSVAYFGAKVGTFLRVFGPHCTGRLVGL